jgi:hypothetical protein
VTVLTKIVSGGQTGVDRAALDVALELGIPCGGWCPKGRLAEDGTIAERYPLTETPTKRYPQRTEWNVRDSDATLILTVGEPIGGTVLTVEVCQRLRQSHLIVDLADEPDPAAVADWLQAGRVSVLNVAGPRESGAPGVHDDTLAFLRDVLSRLAPERSDATVRF